MADFKKIKEILEQNNQENEMIEKSIHKIVSSYSESLDKLMDKIQQNIQIIHHGNIDAISSSIIENYCYEITSLLYYSYTGLEKIGMKIDSISNERKVLFNKVYLEAKGTAQERKSNAEINTHEYLVVESIYRRSYNVLKGKMDSAEKMYNSFKKTLTKRISESDFHRSSSKFSQ